MTIQPKIFFQDSKYAAIRNESKLAYMLLKDLLPLSIENNWVNEKGEIFVKLSRAKLMSLFQIKGTQKIAQVMKELVDYKLIIYKRVGLAKCNEIYICSPHIEQVEDKKEDSNPENIKKCEVKASDHSEMISTEMLETNVSPCETQTHMNTNYTKTNSNKNNISQSVQEIFL